MMDPLEERLKKIEERLEAIEKNLQNVSQPLKPMAPVATKEVLRTYPPSPLQKQTSLLFSWLKENWLGAIGIFLVILAGGWFVSYAFSNDWIRENVRIWLSFGAGALLYLWGVLRLKVHSKSGQLLVILGQAICFLALFAGHQLYNILPAPYLFALMAAIAALTALIAIIKRLEGLAVTSLIAALIIPFLIDTNQPNITFLMSYILLIDLVALAMFLARDWGRTFQIVWFISFLYTFSMEFNVGITYFFISVFYLLFYLPSALSAIGKINKKLPYNGAIILLTSTFALIFWVDAFTLSVRVHTLFYLSAALLSFIFGYFMSKEWNVLSKERTRLNYVLGTIFAFSTMIFLFLGTREMDNFEMRILVYLIEGLLAMATGRYLFKSPVVTSGLAFYFLIPLAALLYYKYPEILYASFNSLDFAILCTATATFVLSTLLVYKTPFSNESRFHQAILLCLEIVTGAFILGLIWNICHNLIPNANTARGAALVIYIIAAELLIYFGNAKRWKELRLAGITIIVLVILRLLFEEVWRMPVVIRTITFVVIGILLIGTAFFDKKYKDQS